VYGVRDAAEQLNAHAETIRRAIREGRLKAHPLGLGPKSGYIIEHRDLVAFAQAHGVALSKKRGTQDERNSEPAVFVESAALLPDDEGTLPTPTLPPVSASMAQLLDYSALCQVLAGAALAEVKRRLAEEGEGGT